MSEEMEDSDIELFLKVIEGDEHAFNKLYYRYKDFVYREIRYKRYDQTVDIDKLTQRVWMKLWRTKKHYIQLSFKTFLRTIINSCFLDALKEIKTIRNKPLDTATSIDDKFSEDDMLIEVPRPLTPEKVRLLEEQKEILEAALFKLSDEKRNVFVFKILDGMKNKEIAEAMDLTVDQVKYLLKLATHELAKHLQEYQL